MASVANARALTVHILRSIGTLHQVNLTSVWFSVKFSFQKFPFLCTAAILMIDWVLTASALNFFERCVHF